MRQYLPWHRDFRGGTLAYAGGGKTVKEPFLGKNEGRSGVLEDKGDAVSRSCRIERDVDPAGLPYA